MNVISDGVNNFALTDTFVLNAKKDEVNAALEKAFMPKDKMSDLFRAARDQYRRQAGGGRYRQRPGRERISKGNVGQFADNMAAAGFDPKAVDMVVISHFHGDHMNGLLDRGRHAGIPECRGAGAGGRVEILDGRRRDGQADQRTA